MKGLVVALDEVKGRKAAALIKDGQLEDLLIESRDEDGPIPGAIYRGICERPMKGQGGMFLRLPDGRAFLRQAKGLTPGQALLVQVSGWAEDGKAAPVTPRVLFKSRYAIVTPEAPGINVSRSIRDEEERIRLLAIAHEVVEDENTGLIIRSQAAGASEEDVEGDIIAMLDLAKAVMADREGKEAELLVEGPDPHELAWRDWAEPDVLDSDPGSFQRHGVDEMISTLRGAKHQLGGGAFAFVEPTRAFVAVDVNTGNATSPAAGLKANIALAKALPRILRCRGLGGQIIVDFAPMPKKDRRQIETSLKASFRADGIETAQAGWTVLGNFELQRKRERLPLFV